MNRTEENWALAHSVKLTRTREGLKPGCHGVVIAERHPTGWFISAEFDPASPTEQVDDFMHFVVVRTYLLLEHGPQTCAWEADGANAWRAHCQSVVGDVGDLPFLHGGVAE